MISADTHRLAGDAFEYRPLEPTSDGVVGYQVVGLGTESRFEVRNKAGLSPMVGRNEELQLLLRRWEKARAGAGQLVLLSAEAGIGKSRLAASFMECLHLDYHIEKSGSVKRAGRCLVHELDDRLGDPAPDRGTFVIAGDRELIGAGGHGAGGLVGELEVAGR